MLLFKEHAMAPPQQAHTMNVWGAGEKKNPGLFLALGVTQPSGEWIPCRKRDPFSFLLCTPPLRALRYSHLLT